MLLDPLVSTIETIKAHIASHGTVLRQNETRTRAALIDPLLQALGWDTTDPALVTPEYRVDVGWADYALAGIGNQPAAVIEAKRLGSIIENHLEQAVGYCIQQGIAYAGVTDGNHWQLYRTFEPVPLAQKLMLDVSLADIPAHETALKMLMLWRPNLASGQPVAANAPVLGLAAEQPSDGSALLEPIRDSSTVTGNWVSLGEFRPGKGQNPPTAIRFSHGDIHPIARWQDVVVKVLENLIENSRFTALDCPWRVGAWTRANTTPFGSSGRNFNLPEKVAEGFYVETSGNRYHLIDRSRNLWEAFGDKSESVELQFE